MTSARNFMITAAMFVGMTVAGSGTAFAATPAAAQTAPSVGITQPSYGNNDWNNDNNRDRDRNDNNRGNYNYNRNYNNNHYGWGFNRRINAVSPWQCRWANGHVDWRDGKCWGGRFSGARLRWW